LGALQSIELFISTLIANATNIKKDKLLLMDRQVMLFNDIVMDLTKCEKVANDLNYGNFALQEIAESIIDSIILLKQRLGIS
jgi:hypothetical protein